MTPEDERRFLPLVFGCSDEDLENYSAGTITPEHRATLYSGCNIVWFYFAINICTFSMSLYVLLSAPHKTTNFIIERFALMFLALFLIYMYLPWSKFWHPKLKHRRGKLYLYNGRLFQVCRIGWQWFTLWNFQYKLLRHGGEYEVYHFMHRILCIYPVEATEKLEGEA